MPASSETLRIGILLDRVDSDIGSALALAAMGDADVLAFFQEPTGFVVPYAALGIADAFGFTGVAVATSLVTAATLLGMPGPSHRFFYVMPEWEGGPMSYEQMSAIFSHPALSLIAPSEELRGVIESLWNVKVGGVVPPDHFEDLAPHIRATIGQA